MASFLSQELGVQGPSFAVEVTGSLGGVMIDNSLVGALVQAVAAITSEPVKRVIIHFMQFGAEIEIVHDKITRKVRVAKFRNIAEVYNKAMLEADGIWYHSPEMKAEYLDILKQDQTRQFMLLLHST